MSGLFKVLLFSCPVLALIFFYVVSQQAKIDVEMKRDDIAFERSWNEFKADFTKIPERRQKYIDRATKADERLKEREQEEKEMEQKAAQFKADFERAIEQFEKKQGGK